VPYLIRCILQIVIQTDSASMYFILCISIQFVEKQSAGLTRFSEGSLAQKRLRTTAVPQDGAPARD